MEEVDEVIAERERVNKFKMEQLNKELSENKIKAVNEAVAELGKVIITQEELQELKGALEKVKTEGRNEVKEQVAKYKQNYEDKLKQQLEVQKLQNERDIAQLRAEVESGRREVENLNATLERMSQELASQKQLTAEVANLNRSSPSNKEQ